MPYLRRVYRLAAELEESLVADLWQAGTLGVSTESEPDGRLRLTAWFEPEAPPPPAAPDGLSRGERPAPGGGPAGPRQQPAQRPSSPALRRPRRGARGGPLRPGDRQRRAGGDPP